MARSPRGESQSLTHVKLELREIAGEVWVAISKYAVDSGAELLGQQDPEPLRMRESRDCRETGSCNHNKQFLSVDVFAIFLVLYVIFSHLLR